MVVAHRHQEMLNANSTFLPAYFYVLPEGRIFICFIITADNGNVNRFMKNIGNFVEKHFFAL